MREIIINEYKTRIMQRMFRADIPKLDNVSFARLPIGQSTEDLKLIIFIANYGHPTIFI